MPTRRQCANALRALAIDAIEQARSGHPGAPLGMADMAEALWRHVLRHNPADPHWPDRDRFVLSNGHASMLLYGLLHLAGYGLSMDDIRQFRQWGSRTPGHPEHGHTAGVEMTTGPLGQGISSAVGMALAEKLLAARFNRPGHNIVDHHTYVLLGDGCLMEGVSHEACALAGVWKLGKLIALYDANGISIDGKVEGWFTEDVAGRFRAYGWQVVGPVDGHDAAALDAALSEARADGARPSLIICRTHIGFGSPHKADSAACHGSPLGPEEAAATKAALEWTAAPFEIPADIAAAWDAREKGRAAQAAWEDAFAAYAAAHPELAAEFSRRMRGDLPADWADIAAATVQQAVAAEESIATRVAGQRALETLVARLPELLGGSADLTGSVGTKTAASVPLDAAAGNWAEANYLSYGVREFGMSAIMNGLALHGGFIPYAGTFMVFSDYAKNAVRLAALMKIRAIWVFTHDSIGVGEDGPTHQPIEQLAGLRLIPNVDVWRPCDTVESAVAWQCALASAHTPSVLSLSRQNVPFVRRDAAQVTAIARGGYVLADCAGTPELILLATGSEVALALEAAAKLGEAGRRVRVVSLPCCERFDAQDAAYREAVLPSSVRARVAVEAASADYWRKYVGLDGAVLGMAGFGASAPGKVLAREFGFTAERLVALAEDVLRDAGVAK
ncbi:MAG TPA: transketolase [Candidatus Desulfovibrio intestinavium]|uniref:Transketolase n=1 Tax=Candidatus Desulfovibrio intestinavium TaxID=2838534 RepID=A0A9D2HM88_9BACT|nr:transketolase [Candidatus Desulfovibrio intestinavium]